MIYVIDAILYYYTIFFRTFPFSRRVPSVQWAAWAARGVGHVWRRCWGLSESWTWAGSADFGDGEPLISELP